MRLITSPKRSNAFLIFVAAIAVIGAFLVGNIIFSPKVRALDANSYPDNFSPYQGIRAYIYNYNTFCASDPRKYAILTWVSPLNDPGNPGPYAVTQGQTHIDLMLNASVFLCNDRLSNESGTSYPGLPNDGTPNLAKVPLTHNYTYVSSASVSASDGSGTGFSTTPAGKEIVIGRDSSSRYWFGPSAGFGVDFASIDRDKTITVTLNIAKMNEFHNGATPASDLLWFGTHAEHENTRAGQDISWFDEDKWTLTKRVDQILTGVHYAEEPLSRITHMVSNVQIKAVRPTVDGVRELDVSSRFLVYQNRVEYETYTFVGRRHDTLRLTDGGWKIARREILLEQSILLAKNLTTFF